MPYIELSITISIVTFPTAESLVISSFKLVQTSREGTRRDFFSVFYDSFTRNVRIRFRKPVLR